jgi:ABC-2 type transport system ATP-binding protein
MVSPSLSILDEPTSGLDVVHAYHVRRIIKEYAQNRGVTILLSSHNMLEVEFLCDRIMFINKGRAVASGSPSDLKSNYTVQNLEEVFMAVTKLS